MSELVVHFFSRNVSHINKIKSHFFHCRRDNLLDKSFQFIVALLHENRSGRCWLLSRVIYAFLVSG